MDIGSQLPVTKVDVEQAMSRLKRRVRATPTLEVQLADCMTDGSSTEGTTPNLVVLKLEYFQYSGSFKARGAFNNLLSRNIAGAGVVAASGGNHGAAVAFAAHQFGIPAHVFVPTISVPAKQKRIKQLGAELIVGGDCYADALAASTEFMKETGAIAIHAYDSFETIAGAGTTALELIKQAPNIDTVLVAVGGGGLIGGIAAYLGDDVKIVAVETEGTDALSSALKAGKPVDVEVSGAAADSLGAKCVGAMSFAISQRYVDESVLVSDDEVRQAQSLLLWRNFRIASESGGAAAFAALSSGAYRPMTDERVAVILCGANTDAVKYSDL